jgi:hypothetical protein
MIINDLDIPGSIFDPFEATSPLIIDTNTIPSRPAPFQIFKPVVWRGERVLEMLGVIQVNQYPASGVLNFQRCQTGLDF